MLTTCWYHVRVSALFLALIACVWALGALPVFRHGDAFFWWTVVFVVGLVQIPYAVAWRARTDRFVHSLPVSRGDVAHGHVLAAVLALAVATLLAVALAAGLASLLWEVRGTCPAWVAPAPLLVFVSVATVLVCLQVAANHRWSMAVAGVVTGLAILLAFVAAAAVTFGEGGPLSGPGGLFDLVHRAAERVGWPTASGLVAAGVIVSFAVTARGCRAFYERREFQEG